MYSIRSARWLFIVSAALAGYIYAAFSADPKAGHGRAQSWGGCAAAHRSEGIHTCGRRPPPEGMTCPLDYGGVQCMACGVGTWAHGVRTCQVAIHVAKDGFTLKNDMQLPPYISGQCASRFATAAQPMGAHPPVGSRAQRTARHRVPHSTGVLCVLRRRGSPVASLCAYAIYLSVAGTMDCSTSA